MKVNNMKELLEYVANKRKHQHYEVAKIYGECKGMGNTRYKVSQKATFAKFKKFTYNKMWRGYDEKYDLKTMKL